MKVFRIDGVHLLDSLLNDSADSSSPTSMNSCNDVLSGIVKKDGYAVGRLDADAKPRLVGYDGIGLLGTTGFPHPADIIRVDLSGQSKFFEAKPQSLHPTIPACRKGCEPRGSLIDNEVIHRPRR